MATNIKECKNKFWYQNLHTKLVKENGNAVKCENPNCGSVKPKRFEWALRKGRNYSLIIKDYIQLCPSCHRKYDANENSKQSISKRVAQFDMNWNLIAEFKSRHEAERVTGVSNSKICQAVKMKEYKSAGGFRWKNID